MQCFVRQGDEVCIYFVLIEGMILFVCELEVFGIFVFVGVGYEIIGVNVYIVQDIVYLLDWLVGDFEYCYVVFDVILMLGVMLWLEDIVCVVMVKCCLFMLFQKVIGGILGYFVVVFIFQVLVLVECNQKNFVWVILCQLKIVLSLDVK